MSIIDGIKGAHRGVNQARAHRAANPEPARIDLSGHLYCKTCGTVAKPSTETPGSILIELVLWCCFIVPGLVYSLWRHNKRHAACPKCGSADLIPADSPLASAGRTR